MSERVIVCEGCYKPRAEWRYDNPFNSSRFCVICGTYCRDMRLEDFEIERFQEKHEKWLREHGRA